MLPVMEIMLPSVSSNVPAFLAKLWKMVDDPSTNHLIDWSDEGNSFIIHNQADFAQKMLPYYYKHSNLASFVRQLNMYGFHKVLGIDSGGLKSERADQMEFAHSDFLRGHGHLLDQIKRKISTGKNSGANSGNYSTTFVPNLKSERVTEVLNEVSIIKDKQDEMDGKLDSMKKENEALWREVVTLRQKHQSQQKIVNKLIQFLVSLVQPRVGGGSSTAVKRRFNNLPLALEGEHSSSAKEPKLSENVNGPIIKDVTHISNADFSCPITSGIIETPYSPMQAVDPTLVSGSIPVSHMVTKEKNTNSLSSSSILNLNDPLSGINTMMTNSRPILTREISKEDIDLDMNNMQKDLDNLKDILSGQVTLDTSIISNIFNPEEPLYSFVPSSGGAPSSNNLSSTPIMDDLLRAMNSNEKSSVAPSNNKLQLECDPPVGLEINMNDHHHHHSSSSNNMNRKKSVLKLSNKIIMEPDDISELNTPAICLEEDPLLTQLNE
ncbi:heat shock factor protein 4 [Lepeophtheirus salmonis]|uniref:heat shock factor protein 4 n=1 Tax=Lepeophtheirus salmonis TaxID=72036 RepID=UPI001AE248EC|nr:heat shock factor protein-like [Lepeophtheirus salmonis]